jgi:hypothetical protein
VSDHASLRRHRVREVPLRLHVCPAGAGRRCPVA